MFESNFILFFAYLKTGQVQLSQALEFFGLLQRLIHSHKSNKEANEQQSLGQQAAKRERMT